jgi:hypothetical protein
MHQTLTIAPSGISASTVLLRFNFAKIINSGQKFGSGANFDRSQHARALTDLDGQCGYGLLLFPYLLEFRHVASGTQKSRFRNAAFGLLRNLLVRN